MPVNPDSIPRYQLPTDEELDEMYGGSVADLCETCGHCVLVVDRANSRRGRLRILTVCVAIHDEDGSETAEEVAGPIGECDKYVNCEDAA